MDIHNYTIRVEQAKVRFKEYRDGEVVLAFFNHLKTNGLTDARIWFYASRMKIVLKWFQEHDISLKNASRSDVEAFLSYILSRSYKAWTKHAYYILVKKLISFSKTGKTDVAVEEVSWMKVSQFEKQAEKESRATPESLLTQDEFLKLVSASGSTRNRAIIYVAYEAALRPSELLTMKVASVVFKEKYCLISATGKTGVKRMPLITSFPLLLQLLKEHPLKDTPEAWLWIDNKGNRLSIYAYYALLKRASKRAGLRKPIWAYLLRHARLTEMAKVLTEVQLNLFAGWVQGSDRAKTYVHFSARDLEDTLLEINGLKQSEKEAGKMKLKTCSRCNNINPPDALRCEKCGLILDPKLALQVEKEQDGSIKERIDRIEEKLSNLLSSESQPSSS